VARPGIEERGGGAGPVSPLAVASAALLDVERLAGVGVDHGERAIGGSGRTPPEGGEHEHVFGESVHGALPAPLGGRAVSSASSVESRSTSSKVITRAACASA